MVTDVREVVIEQIPAYIKTLPMVARIAARYCMGAIRYQEIVQHIPHDTKKLSDHTDTISEKVKEHLEETFGQSNRRLTMRLVIGINIVVL